VRDRCHPSRSGYGRPRQAMAVLRRRSWCRVLSEWSLLGGLRGVGSCLQTSRATTSATIVESHHRRRTQRHSKGLCTSILDSRQSANWRIQLCRLVWSNRRRISTNRSSGAHLEKRDCYTPIDIAHLSPVTLHFTWTETSSCTWSGASVRCAWVREGTVGLSKLSPAG